MKYRTFAFGAAVAAAATGLLPATAMAASAHVATTPPSTSAGANSGAGSNSGATANNQNTINLKVVTQLPKDVRWGDVGNKNVLINNNTGNVLQAPPGYDYTNGGLYSNDGHFYIDPAGAHGTVVSENYGSQRCDPRDPGGIGGIIHNVLKACGDVYQWAFNAIESAAGTQPARASYC